MKYTKITLLLLMTLLTVIHNYNTYWGRWATLFGVTAWQMLSIKEITAYLFNKDIKFVRGPGIGRDADPRIRTLAGFFYFLSYIAMFFIP